MTGRRCIAVSAFWHANEEDGFSIEMHEYESQSLDQAIEQIDKFVIHIAENDPHKDIDSINEYFQWIGRVKPTDQAEQMMALAMVAYAEEQGLLVSDEYNGVVYAYEDAGNVLTIHRKDHDSF